MKIDHIALQVSDIYEACEWYCGHFNANVAYFDQSWAQDDPQTHQTTGAEWGTESPETQCPQLLNIVPKYGFIF